MIEALPSTAAVPDLFNAAAYRFSWAQAPHFLAALLIVAAAGAIWRAERGTRIARHYVIFSTLFALWVAGRGVIHMLDDPQLATHLARNLFALASVAMPLLLRVVAMIMQRESGQQGFIVANWLLAMVFALAAFNTPWFVTGTERYSWGLEPVFGWIGYLYMVWIFTLMAYESVELSRAWRAAAPGSVERRRLQWFAAAMLSLYFAIVEFFSALQLPVYPFGGLGVLGFTLLVAHITLRFGLAQLTAQLAAHEIIDMVRGALLIVGHDGLIRLLSARGARLLGLDRRAVVGRPAHVLLGKTFHPEGLAELARREDGLDEKEMAYQRPLARTSTMFALSASTVNDRHGRQVAYVCMLRDLTEQKRVEQDRHRERLTDGLTGLPNRSMFLGLLDAAVERCRKDPAYRYSLCMIGLDRMRRVNDEYGNDAGDRLLAGVSERLRGASRPQDAVARIGGDEFAVLVRGLGTTAELTAYISHLRQALCAPISLGDREYTPSAHFGSASNIDGHCDADELLRIASAAMYREKQSPLAA